MIQMWLRAAIATLITTACFGKSPNVIVILTDDQGYGDLSCHGNPHLKTPHLDSLRNQSTSLNRYFVSPTCSPTRAAMMTGRHEFAVGVSHTIAGRSMLRPGVPTIPEILKGKGYATGIFGKWHLGDAYPCRPEDRGFEHIFVHGSGGIGQAADYWGNGYFDPHIRTKEGWVETKGYCTDVFFNETKSWIKQQVDDEKPFFVWLATNAPHGPWIPPNGADEPFLKAGLKNPVASFYAMIENIDTNLGGLVDELDALGIADDTILIFTSDNGSAMGHWNAGMKGKKGTPDEGGVRVPFFIRWPDKIESGKVIENVTAHVDLLPTLADVCGAELPKDWVGDGVNLSDALLGKGEYPSGRNIFTHKGRWTGDEPVERYRTQNFSVRNDRWRLVGIELFDMLADPGQKKNVFEEHTEDANQMLVDYGRWWNSILPSLRTPVRYHIGHLRAPVIHICSHDWWPSLESDSKALAPLWNHRSIQKQLESVKSVKKGGKVRNAMGHWKLYAERDGRYRVKMALLPDEAPEELRNELGKLKAGTAHIRTGKREVQAEVLEGATSVSLDIDLDKGPVDLEAWFGGQLPNNQNIGAIYCSIRYTGEKQDKIPDLRIGVDENKGAEK